MSNTIAAIPAFPYTPERRTLVGDNLYSIAPGDVPGMTLRDYFAAKAIAPLVENHVRGILSYGNEQEMARRAYEIADAMLATRSAAPGAMTAE